MVYGAAKTVADLFKYRNKLGFPIAVSAIRDTLLSGLSTAEDIWRFAEICRVTKVIRHYLDVLEARRGQDIRLARQAFLARERARARSQEAPLPGHPESAG
ncbi:hypothetical protein A176_002308 [Myxococcus hansupus]|uniref:Uncharacterized protein n=1 Tax=Pseudomyxococcus hansupus TaxID=1297742 RepID=A0A0H4WPG5_9BACT|nr:hypothetical protein A176_002308 [Myxococcus hansupus]